MTKMLVFAAERAKTRPNYLAWVLEQYKETENLSDDDLAKFLQIKISQMPRLKLCLKPRTAHFAADVEQISSKHGLDSHALAKVIRLVDSVSAMVTAKTDSRYSGVLMAARARKTQRKQQEKEDSRGKRSKS